LLLRGHLRPARPDLRDRPALTSTHTRQAFGWEPRQLSLLEDLENIEP